MTYQSDARFFSDGASTSKQSEPLIHGRYSDQPPSLGSRLAGGGGATFAAMLALAGSLLTWHTYVQRKPPATLRVFDVAAPAAPPEKPHEARPGPEKVAKLKQPVEPDRKDVPPPVVALPDPVTVPTLVARPKPDPGPIAKETTAPEARPEPPAPQASSGKPTWEGLVLAALNKVKRYPRDAHFARQQGIPYIRFVMDREGRVLSARLERASGVRSLDEEALTLPKRAQPLPKPPADVKGETIELVVPVEFFIQ